jgi:YVTN family beta-propeller protein
MTTKKVVAVVLSLGATAGLLTAAAVGAADSAPATAVAKVATVAGMPPVVDARNLYSETGAGMFNAEVRQDLERIYVPNLRSRTVSVIDPQTLKVVDTFKVGRAPQHIVPSWDLRTLWVTNNAERRNDGSLTPINPRTGKPGKEVKVDDPYNLYFTPDGKSAIVVAEAKHRLDFRDPQTFELQYSIEAPQCGGINHGDFSMDGKTAFFTCEFEGSLVRIDLEARKATDYLKLTMPATRLRKNSKVFDPLDTEICTAKKGMPQDIRISPDGKTLFVADMSADGVHLVDAVTFKQIGFITVGVATHGLYPSRDGKSLYAINRGSHAIHGKPNGAGSVSIIDFATRKVMANWPVPGGGSPDMGNVSNDGLWLWLSGRFDDEVYRFDTSNGDVRKIKVGMEPHGLVVWPLPGRYSLGHTGNLR